MAGGCDSLAFDLNQRESAETGPFLATGLHKRVTHFSADRVEVYETASLSVIFAGHALE